MRVIHNAFHTNYLDSFFFFFSVSTSSTCVVYEKNNRAKPPPRHWPTDRPRSASGRSGAVKQNTHFSCVPTGRNVVNNIVLFGTNQKGFWVEQVKCTDDKQCSFKRSSIARRTVKRACATSRFEEICVGNFYEVVCSVNVTLRFLKYLVIR